MSQGDRWHGVVHARKMLDYARSKGLPISACLHGTGLCEGDVERGERQITARQQLGIAANLVRHLAHEPALGLELGLQYHFTDLGFFGLALISSRTLRSALRQALAVHRLLPLPTMLSLELDSQVARIDIAIDPRLPPPLAQFVLNRFVGIAAALLRDILPGRPGFHEVQFSYDEPCNAVLVRRLLRCEPGFGSPRNVIVLDAAAVESPLPFANQAANEHALELCLQRIGESLKHPPYSNLVGSRVTDRAGNLGMQDVADAFHLSQRTLRRRLKHEGITFKQIVEEARRARALQLLGESQESLESIAERLGYATAGGLSAAFKRWTGHSPGSRGLPVKEADIGSDR